MGNQGEFICPNCQGKLLHMVQKKDMTKDEINIEIEEAKKGNGMDRFKIIDEKLYRYEWESGLMIWSYTKKELKWNKTKEGTWFCKCGYYSQNYNAIFLVFNINLMYKLIIANIILEIYNKFLSFILEKNSNFDLPFVYSRLYLYIIFEIILLEYHIYCIHF